MPKAQGMKFGDDLLIIFKPAGKKIPENTAVGATIKMVVTIRNKNSAPKSCAINIAEKKYRKRIDSHKPSSPNKSRCLIFSCDSILLDAMDPSPAKNNIEPSTVEIAYIGLPRNSENFCMSTISIRINPSPRAIKYVAA